MKKRFKSKNLKFTLLVATILLVGVGIAYAALSTTLTITFGKITQSALSWNVAFEGSSATGTASGTSNTGLTCGNATITATSVTVADTTLSKPGDKCTYTLTVKNSGTVDAKLNAITPTAPSDTTCGTSTGGTLICGNITYKLTSDQAGSNVISTGTTLASNNSQTIYLVVSYNASGLQSTSITQTGGKFTLSYVQA